MSTEHAIVAAHRTPFPVVPAAMAVFMALSLGVGTLHAGVSVKLSLEGRAMDGVGAPGLLTATANRLEDQVVTDFSYSGTTDPHIPYRAASTHLKADFEGSIATIEGAIAPPEFALRSVPQMHVHMQTVVPVSWNRLGDPNIDYDETSELVLEDILRVDTARSSPRLAAVRPKFHFHAHAASINPRGMTYNRPYIGTSWEVAWGNSTRLRRWDTLTYYDDNGQPTGVARDLTDALLDEWTDAFEAPAASLLSEGIHLKIVWKTRVIVAQTDRGEKHALFAALNTVALDGLIPYDAQGNVLPSSALVLTSDEGWDYPVLDPTPPPARPLILTNLVYYPTQSRLSFSWNAATGRNYTIWHSKDLKEWIQLPGVVTSFGQYATFSDRVVPADTVARYYQVREEP